MTSKGIISLILGIAGLLYCLVWPNETVTKVALGLTVGGIIEFIGYLYENRKQWDILKLQLLHPGGKMRLTVAYLYRIELNGKYLLIRRHKNDNNVGFQPVGGAYKYWPGETREIFQKLEIEPCSKITRDADMEDDLRVTIGKRRNLQKFLKWFSSRKNREIDPLREFYEELVRPGLLPEEPFRHIKYAYLGKHQEFAIPSPVFNVDEFRYADTFELKLETPEQKAAIQALTDREEIIFATAEEIRNKRTQDGRAILPHSFKILPNDNN